MSDRSVVQAREAFSVPIRGVPLNVSPGDRFWSDDPVVKGNPALFEELSVRSSIPAPPLPTAVETADAAPGTARRMTRPKRTADSPKETSDA